jgi:hypothetical protein
MNSLYKNIKNRIILLLGLIGITIMFCFLIPVGIILIIFKPIKFQIFIFKIVNFLNILDWLYKIASKQTNFD